MNLKLGKKPARIDGRTFKFESLLVPANLPPLLPEYDVDQILGVVDNHVYLNDIYGDCVEAGSAHMINRFEKFECKSLPNITDSAVKRQYFKETGGTDDGLVLLDHLNMWRKTGLKFCKTYKIDAFASIDWKDHNQVMYGVQLLNGVYLGMQVPAYFMDDFNAGKWLFDVQTKNAQIEGGHCIYSPAVIPIVGYNATGPIIVTWGKRVQLTWAFWDRFVDEAYVLVDAMDKWVKNSPLNIPLLRQYLAAIEAG